MRANVLGEGALHKYDAAGRFLRNLDAADWGNTTGLANDPTDENFSGCLAVSSGRLTVGTAPSWQKSTWFNMARLMCVPTTKTL